MRMLSISSVQKWSCSSINRHTTEGTSLSVEDEPIRKKPQLVHEPAGRLPPLSRSVPSVPSTALLSWHGSCSESSAMRTARTDTVPSLVGAGAGSDVCMAGNDHGTDLSGVSSSGSSLTFSDYGIGTGAFGHASGATVMMGSVTSAGRSSLPAVMSQWRPKHLPSQSGTVRDVHPSQVLLLGTPESEKDAASDMSDVEPTKIRPV